MHDSHAESTGKVGTTEGLQRLGDNKVKELRESKLEKSSKSWLSFGSRVRPAPI